MVKLAACLVPSRPGALRDAEDSASRRPAPSTPAKEQAQRSSISLTR